MSLTQGGMGIGAYPGMTAFRQPAANIRFSRHKRTAIFAFIDFPAEQL